MNILLQKLIINIYPLKTKIIQGMKKIT
jgi:hypothetical protein